MAEKSHDDAVIIPDPGTLLTPHAGMAESNAVGGRAIHLAVSTRVDPTLSLSASRAAFFARGALGCGELIIGRSTGGA